MRIRYNSPVILTFSLVSALILLLDQITGGTVIKPLLILTPTFSLASPLSWLRLFSYVLVHENWTHLISNFSFILLIGPILEEKYGSLALFVLMLITAAGTAILNILIVKSGLLGASGIAFMLILLSSFTNIRQGDIPVTFILIVALYLVKEFVNAFSQDTISQLAHIAGGFLGGMFGFLFARKEPAAQKTPPGVDLPPETKE